MRRQRSAIDLPPARRNLLSSRGVVLRRGVCRRERLLHSLQRQRELLGIEPLGAALKAVPLQLPNDCCHPLELLGMVRPLGQEQRMHCIGIGGEGITRGHRSASKTHHRTSVAPRLASESLCRIA
jgi:hypothetical protein